MKTVGIITEYNPMHNGHIYHIEETRRLSNADRLVCVMSGNFTQRGEPMILDKFTRTKWALQNGVDLVVELPFVFTVQNANIFAQTSVEILHHLGVDEIYFGSESGNVNELIEYGEILQSTKYNNLIQGYIKKGYSYPTSSDLAMKEILPNNAFDLPNNILGIQYILAGKALNSNITFHTIKRQKAGYYDTLDSASSIQSATTIRQLACSKKTIDDYVPKDVAKSLQTRKLITYEHFFDQINYILSSTTNTELEAVFGFDEGIENRFLKAKNYVSVESLIEQVISKRYTNANLKRTIAHMLVNTKKNVLTDFTIPYIRVLGMNQKGQEVLRDIKHDITVPLIVKVKEKLHPYLDIELRVSKIYSLVSDEDIYNQEFKQPII
jgi:predicted nucleotidyltransferase